MASKELEKLSIDNSPPQITAEGQRAKERIAAARAQRNAEIQPTVSAKDLTQPVTAPTITPTPVPQIPPRVGTTVNNVLGSIRSQSETAKQLEDEQRAFGAFADGQTGFDIQQEQLQRFGVTPEKLQELEDIQLQLSDRATTSGLKKVEIESGGQGSLQGQRSLTQEDREEAVRSAGLASRAAVLQGNIQTGRALANDAVNIALQDRTFKANALRTQIADLKEVVDEETRQLLVAEDRKYEAEQATIKELKDNISEAMVSGASQAEISQMNDPNVDDETKLSLARSIIARNATTDIELAREGQRASIRSSNASAALNELELRLTKEATDKAEADAAAGIIPPEAVAVAQTINKDFEDEPIVKAYNEGLQKYIVLEDTLENGIDGIQDLQLVYAFMKAVDPESVVRESEFATAADTGNIFQGAYARFNKAFGTGGFLPEEVKNDFIRSARASFDAQNTQYYNVKNEKAKQINQRLGISNGADYLTSYESAAPLQQADFDLADTLAGATDQDMLEIMQMQNELLKTPSGQSGI